MSEAGPSTSGRLLQTCEGVKDLTPSAALEKLTSGRLRNWNGKFQACIHPNTGLCVLQCLGCDNFIAVSNVSTSIKNHANASPECASQPTRSSPRKRKRSAVELDEEELALIDAMDDDPGRPKQAKIGFITARTRAAVVDDLFKFAISSGRPSAP
jgi:hypothetical protein